MIATTKPETGIMDSAHGAFDPAIGADAVRDAKRRATQAGITEETTGEWMNLAVRHERMGRHQDAAHCARQALKVADTWGRLLPCYGMADGVRVKAIALANEVAP